MYAKLKFDYDRKIKIRKLKNKIKQLEYEIEKIEKNNKYNPTWWYIGHSQIPTIKISNYDKIMNYDDVKFAGDTKFSGDTKFDYYIILDGEFDHDNDNDCEKEYNILFTMISDIIIYNNSKEFCKMMNIIGCGGAAFSTIKIIVLDNILYYKYQNNNYIEFTNSFIKEILEIICLKN